MPFILISSVARLPTADDRLDLRLILKARHRLIVGEAGRAHGGDQRLERLVDERPFVLGAEQELDRRERLVVADAARQHEGRDVERIAREFAEDVFDLAGVDIVLLQFGEDLAAERSAMGAGQRAILDHRHAGGVADREFRQRPRLEHRSHVDRAVRLGNGRGRKAASAVSAAAEKAAAKASRRRERRPSQAPEQG